MNRLAAIVSIVAAIATTRIASADRAPCSPDAIRDEIDRSDDNQTVETALALSRFPRVCLVGGLVQALHEKSWKAAVLTKLVGVTDPALLDALMHLVIHNDGYIDGGFSDVLDALAHQAKASPQAIGKLGKLIAPNIDAQAQVLALQLLATAGRSAHTQLAIIAIAADSDDDSEVRDAARATLATLLGRAARAGNSIAVTITPPKKVHP